jgi:hypothetical protein
MSNNEYLEHLILEYPTALEKGNVEDFWSRVWQTKLGRGFAKHLGDTPNHRAAILKSYRELYGNEAIVLPKFVALLESLMYTHSPIFDYPVEPEAEPVDARPRDALGRVMSEKASKWQRWEQLCADPNTSMKLINQWRTTEPGFADFYRTTFAKQVAIQRVGDEAVNLNTKAPTKKAAADVVAYAHRYPAIASETLKREMSAGHVGAAVAAENRRLFESAVAAGLI